MTNTQYVNDKHRKVIEKAERLKEPMQALKDMPDQYATDEVITRWFIYNIRTIESCLKKEIKNDDEAPKDTFEYK